MRKIHLLLALVLLFGAVSVTACSSADDDVVGSAVDDPSAGAGGVDPGKEEPAGGAADPVKEPEEPAKEEPVKEEPVVDPAIVEIIALGLDLDADLLAKIAEFVAEDPGAVVTIEDIKMLAEEKECLECGAAIDMMAEVTTKISDAVAMDVLPMKDARMRGTAAELAAGNPVAAVDAAAWIENLKEYISDLE